jgi:hypothetical protein
MGGLSEAGAGASAALRAVVAADAADSARQNTNTSPTDVNCASKVGWSEQNQSASYFERIVHQIDDDLLE